MTYENLIKKINSDESRIAKGYDIGFLQNLCVYAKDGEEKFDNLIAKDLKLFKLIEEEIIKKEEPQEGDFVEYADGLFARISRNHQNKNFQLSNKIGVFVSKGGTAQASGCTWDSDLEDIAKERLKFNNLKPTTKTMKGHCWMFSDGNSGAHRGVYYDILFNVWQLGEL